MYKYTLLTLLIGMLLQGCNSAATDASNPTKEPAPDGTDTGGTTTGGSETGGSGTGGSGTAHPDLPAPLFVANDTGMGMCIETTNPMLAAGEPNLLFCDLENKNPEFYIQDSATGLDSDINVDSTNGLLGFDFTKLDATGAPLNPQNMTYQAAPWDCVYDRNTGLFWEVKTNDQVNHDLRDISYTYHWYNSDSDSNYGFPGLAFGGINCFDGSECNTEKYVEDVNKTSLCGFTDWRLPSRYEITSIRYYSNDLPVPADGETPISGGFAIDDNYFPNTSISRDGYWTRSNDKDKATQVHAVMFEARDGGENIFSTITKDINDNEAYIRLVRGGKHYDNALTGQPEVPLEGCASNIYHNAPNERFEDNVFGDGTTVDLLTNLMWKKCAEGQTFVASTQTCTSATGDGLPLVYEGWHSALGTAVDANTVEFAAHTDWRLPSIKELGSIAEFACKYPTINKTIFPGIKDVTNETTDDTSIGAAVGMSYWSSTPNGDQVEKNKRLVWLFQFRTGMENANGNMDTGRHLVLLVRDNI